MEIRDVVHGAIRVEARERPIIDSRFFQRLRQIKQLGFAEFSFPSATHNRYIHSLGAMETATQAFDTIFGRESTEESRRFSALAPTTRERFREGVRLAAILHDIGHGPLSHTTEFAMPDASALGLPNAAAASSKRKSRQATHEDYTLKIILDSNLTPLIEKAGASLGLAPKHVAALIDGELETHDDFFFERVEGERVDFRPVLGQLISSELDADRMDYLRRDSLHAGVSYGQFDFNWLVGNLTAHVRSGRCYLGLEHRALYSFEDFLISRYHMFLMVYFHYKSVVFDEMLQQYLTHPSCDYRLPSDIEAYGGTDDSQLAAHLASSKNEWARRIAERRPYRMLVELHSAIPATKTAHAEQERLRVRIEKELGTQGIHFLQVTSTGELSKYFRKPGDPIYVRYDNHYSAPSFIPLEQCTDLFQKYEEKRVITRLYVSPEHYADCRNNGRGLPLRYEDELPHSQ